MKTVIVSLHDSDFLTNRHFAIFNSIEHIKHIMQEQLYILANDDTC